MKRLALGLILMSIASSILAGKFYLVSRSMLNSTYWQGSYGRAPVQLAKGSVAEVVFVTQSLGHDHSDKPVITITFEYPITSEPLRCIFPEQQDIDRVGCEGEVQPLEVDWLVWENTSAVPSRDIGELGTSLAQSPMSLALAVFNAEPGKEYKVVLQVLESSKRLQPIRSHLEVRLHPDIHKQVYAVQGIVYASSVGFAVVSGVCLLFAVGVARKSSASSL